MSEYNQYVIYNEMWYLEILWYYDGTERERILWDTERNENEYANQYYETRNGTRTSMLTLVS